MEEQKVRLTRGLSAGPRTLFVPGCRPVDRRLFVSCKPFSCTACPGIAAFGERFDQMVIAAFLHRFTWDFVCSSFRRGVQDSLSSMPWRPWRAKETVVSWANRPVGVASCQAALRPAAPPCAAPPRPARGMSGFWTRQVGYKTFTVQCIETETSTLRRHEHRKSHVNRIRNTTSG